MLFWVTTAARQVAAECSAKGAKALAVRCDVTDRSSCEAAAREVLADLQQAKQPHFFWWYLSQVGFKGTSAPKSQFFPVGFSFGDGPSPLTGSFSGSGHWEFECVMFTEGSQMKIRPSARSHPDFVQGTHLAVSMEPASQLINLCGENPVTPVTIQVP